MFCANNVYSTACRDGVFCNRLKNLCGYFVISGRKLEILKDQTVLLFWYAASMY